MKSPFVLSFSFLLLVLGGCAGLESPYSDQRFIPREELNAVMLAREALFEAKRSRFVDAELKYRQALYLEPEAWSVWEGLAVVLAQQGSIEEARAIYARLLDRAPESTDLMLSLARMEFEAEEYERAAEIYERLLELVLDKNQQLLAKDIAQNLAVVYFRIGREEQALCFGSYVTFLGGDRFDWYRYARLLNALGFPEMSAQSLARLQDEQVEAARDPQLLVQRAMASFGNAATADAAQALDILDELGVNDPALEYDRQLVRSLTRWRSGSLIAMTSEDLEELEDLEEEEDVQLTRFLAGLRESPGLDNTRALYFPLAVLEALWELSEQGRAGELDESNGYS